MLGETEKISSSVCIHLSSLVLPCSDSNLEYLPQCRERCFPALKTFKDMNSAIDQLVNGWEQPITRARTRSQLIADETPLEGPRNPDQPECASWSEKQMCELGLECPLDHPPRTWASALSDEEIIRMQLAEAAANDEADEVCVAPVLCAVMIKLLLLSNLFLDAWSVRFYDAFLASFSLRNLASSTVESLHCRTRFCNRVLQHLWPAVTIKTLSVFCKHFPRPCLFQSPADAACQG